MEFRGGGGIVRWKGRPWPGRKRGFGTRFPPHFLAAGPPAPRLARSVALAIRLAPPRPPRLDHLLGVWYDAVFDRPQDRIRSAPSPSGKAEVCKTSIPGSNPGGASNINFARWGPFRFPTSLRARGRSANANALCLPDFPP